MQSRSSGPRRIAPLTRISVTGGRGFYIVRHGDEMPVKLWLTREGVRCECEQAGCPHETSLRMCGFLEPTSEQAKAA